MATGPLNGRLVLLMIGISDDPKELGIAVDTATVLGRTPAFAGDTTRIGVVVIGRLEPFVHEHVLPVVAEVVRIHGGWSMPATPIEEL